jgi:hypothetical protein
MSFNLKGKSKEQLKEIQKQFKDAMMNEIRKIDQKAEQNADAHKKKYIEGFKASKSAHKKSVYTKQPANYLSELHPYSSGHILGKQNKKVLIEYFEKGEVIQKLITNEEWKQALIDNKQFLSDRLAKTELLTYNMLKMKGWETKIYFGQNVIQSIIRLKQPIAPYDERDSNRLISLIHDYLTTHKQLIGLRLCIRLGFDKIHARYSTGEFIIKNQMDLDKLLYGELKIEERFKSISQIIHQWLLDSKKYWEDIGDEQGALGGAEKITFVEITIVKSSKGACLNTNFKLQ